MKTGLVFTLLLGASLALYTVSDNAREQYEEFKQTYGKNYAGDDDDYRFTVFKQNLQRIHEIQQNELGTAEYGVTEYSDMTPEEFKARMINADFQSGLPEMEVENVAVPNNMPPSFDWRTKGAVNPVEDQSACGSCWAFSVTANIEGQWFLKKGKKVVLSKQQLVDCDKVDHGCHGGWPPKTYEVIVKMGGMMMQKDYPYQRRESGSCQMDKKKFAVYINSSVILNKNEGEQAAWLFQNGPFASALNADYTQHYRRGIMNPRFCDPRGMNHAVVTVGYGVENDTPYWIIRNSWGPGFGEQGYFRILRGSGTCGINLVSTSAKIY